MINIRLIYSCCILLLTGFVFIFSSCSDDDPEPTPEAADGFFIVSEGAYRNSNASLSYFNRETNSIINNVFITANGRSLGDQAQSMSIYEEKGYVVVQNSSKVEVISTQDYSSIATISEGIISPRYFQGFSSTKGYLTDWGEWGIDGKVMVVDLTSNSITKTVSTGQGANKMLLKGSNLYVCNAGGWGYDSTVVVINTSTDDVKAKITVGQNPNSIQEDKDGNIWVASGGYIAYDQDWNVDMASSIPGSITRINTNNEVALKLDVESIFSGPACLCVNTAGNVLYFIYNGAVYSMSVSATAFPTSALITKSFYGLAIDPFNDNILGLEAPDFASNGNLVIYDGNGMLLETHTAGIAPNDAAF